MFQENTKKKKSGEKEGRKNWKGEGRVRGG